MAGWISEPLADFGLWERRERKGVLIIGLRAGLMYVIMSNNDGNFRPLMA